MQTGVLFCFYLWHWSPLWYHLMIHATGHGEHSIKPLRVAEIRLTWLLLSEIGGYPSTLWNAVRQIKDKNTHYFIQQILSSQPLKKFRVLQKQPWGCWCIIAASSYNLTRSTWMKPSPEAIMAFIISIKHWVHLSVINGFVFYISGYCDGKSERTLL